MLLDWIIPLTIAVAVGALAWWLRGRSEMEERVALDNSWRLQYANLRRAVRMTPEGTALELPAPGEVASPARDQQLELLTRQRAELKTALAAATEALRERKARIVELSERLAQAERILLEHEEGPRFLTEPHEDPGAQVAQLQRRVEELEAQLGERDRFLEVLNGERDSLEARLRQLEASAEAASRAEPAGETLAEMVGELGLRQETPVTAWPEPEQTAPAAGVGAGPSETVRGPAQVDAFELSADAEFPAEDLTGLPSSGARQTGRPGGAGGHRPSHPELFAPPSGPVKGTDTGLAGRLAAAASRLSAGPGEGAAEAVTPAPTALPAVQAPGAPWSGTNTTEERALHAHRDLDSSAEAPVLELEPSAGAERARPAHGEPGTPSGEARLEATPTAAEDTAQPAHWDIDTTAAQATPAESTGARSADGSPDDLRRIRGIGPAIQRKLQDRGVTTFRQIALWTDPDIEATERALGGPRGRIRRNDWVGSARAEHLRKYGVEP